MKIPLTDAAGNPVPGLYIMKDVTFSFCQHFGKKLNERVPCIHPNCEKRHVLLDLFQCEIYNKCTPTKPAKGIACCAGCPHNQGNKKG